MAGLSRLIAKELSEALGTTLTKADDTVKALGEVPVKGIVSNNEYENILRSADTIDNIKDWKASVKATVAEQRKITNLSPVERTPELEVSAIKLIKDKSITREQHLEEVNKFKPITEWDNLPSDPSDKALVFSLNNLHREKGFFLLPEDVASKLGVNSAEIKEGSKILGRLDIPAYKDYDTWIVTNTVAGGKGSIYSKSLHYVSKKGEPVKFKAGQAQGERIGTGEDEKIGYANIVGFYKNSSPSKLREMANKYLKNPEWSQVGFDPRRTGAFYLRKENKLGGKVGDPIKEAEEVIQIGPLILAKNAIIDELYSGYFEGGLVKGLMSR